MTHPYASENRVTQKKRAFRPAPPAAPSPSFLVTSAPISGGIITNSAPASPGHATNPARNPASPTPQNRVVQAQIAQASQRPCSRATRDPDRQDFDSEDHDDDEEEHKGIVCYNDWQESWEDENRARKRKRKSEEPAETRKGLEVIREKLRVLGLDRSIDSTLILPQTQRPPPRSAFPLGNSFSFLHPRDADVQLPPSTDRSAVEVYLFMLASTRYLEWSLYQMGKFIVERLGGLGLKQIEIHFENLELGNLSLMLGAHFAQVAVRSRGFVGRINFALRSQAEVHDVAEACRATAPACSWSRAVSPQFLLLLAE
ncbi:hypothetical protein BT69DRAFT_1293595 [Atractiella rhizophila]|nr:hypothetical protein BT69DRAFT_1293595 [Atractiella rhizophila]